MLIDTLKAKNRLVNEYGVDERQAEGLVELIASAEDNLVTKQDLDQLRQEISQLRQDLEQHQNSTQQDISQLRQATQQDIIQLRQNMQKDLTALEAQLTRKMYGVALLIITVLGALNFFT